MKVYCAGPLFNIKEQEEMAEIAEALENNGYDTFLPQRDGLELSKISKYLEKHLKSNDKVNALLVKAIFSLDIFQVINSNALILNMNGRVPDEGAMVEAGVAWSSDIPVVIYKNDSRSTFNGTDNPMVLGLSNFEIINDVEKIPAKVNSVIFENKNNHVPLNFLKVVDFGKKITDIMSSLTDCETKAIKLLKMFQREEDETDHSNRLREKDLHSSQRDIEHQIQRSHI